MTLKKYLKGMEKMIYVTSDLHGCYDEFIELLSQIDFTDKDEMYIVGDIVDRGPEPIRLLQYTMNNINIHLIMGNHEEMMFDCLIPPNCSVEEKRCLQNSLELACNRYLWVNENGGKTTAEKYNALTYKEQSDIYHYIKNLEPYKRLCVNGVNYLLVHGAPTKKFLDNHGKNKVDSDIFWERIEGCDIHMDLVPGFQLITGHTPTVLYGNEYAGLIMKGKNKYLIDCGGVFGYSFASLCLDNLQENYVKRKSEDLP